MRLMFTLPESGLAFSRTLKVGAAVTLLPLFFGVSAPSCGGTQALQQQIDQATALGQEQKKQLQDLQNQLKATQTELVTVKTLAGQLSETLVAQKQLLEQLGKAPARTPGKLAAAPGKRTPAAAAGKNTAAHKAKKTTKKAH